MQKVVGSNPIIRFTKAPLDGVVCCLRRNHHRLVDGSSPSEGSKDVIPIFPNGRVIR